MGFTLKNESDNSGLADTEPVLYANRVIVGTRSVRRGERFRAYINLADEQNPLGIAIVPTVTVSSFVTRTDAPTGRAVHVTPWNDNWIHACSVQFDMDTVTHYNGRFMVFLRARQTAGNLTNDTILVRLGHVGMLYGFTPYTEEKGFTLMNRWQALNFGMVEFPPIGLPYDSVMHSRYGNEISIQIRATRAAPHTSAEMDLMDVVLVPADEWIGEFIDPTENAGYFSKLGVAQITEGQRHLQVNPIKHPKHKGLAQIMSSWATWAGAPTGTSILRWLPIMGVDPVLQPNEEQKLWLFTEALESVGADEWISEPWQCYRLQMWRNSRWYAFGRGQEGC